MLQRIDDQTLIKKLRARDKVAFAALVRELHGSLVHVAMTFVSSRATAEEVAQDTWGNMASLISRLTSPRQHTPAGFLISQAHLPALTSAVMCVAIVQPPVSAISRSMSARENPKQ